MKANLILKSSAVFDGLGDNPFPGFVAVSGNRILAAGPLSEMPVLASPDTRVMDWGDRLIMPGFHDSHTHLLLAGMFKIFPNLGRARSEEETASLLKEYYDANPVCGWRYGFNWYHVYWDKPDLPHKRTLDRYFPDDPVFLINAEAHGAWVNSKALELAGITDDTPDPFGGEIKRDSNGEATGFLYESAMAPVASIALDFTESQERLFVRKFMEEAAALGITSVVDVQPYFGRDLGSLEAYAAMERSGDLTVRITAAANLLGDLDKALENSERYRGEKLRAHMLKQFVDGVITTHTALLLEDYLDAPGNRGIPLFELDRIGAAVLEAHKRGLWIKIHAIGDRAIRFTLDRYEEALRKYGDRGNRHAIEHAELIHPDDLHRFGELAVVPSVQPEHLGLMPTWEGEEYRKSLGDEKAAATWPFRTLLGHTGVLALGSDCPVVDNNPFLAIHRAVTRLHDDGLPEGGWNPGEKLTVAEALRGYTLGSAYGIGREDDLGTLEPGKFADIVVVDRNLFAVTPDEIRKARVDMTMMDGRIVYLADKTRHDN